MLWFSVNFRVFAEKRRAFVKLSEPLEMNIHTIEACNIVTQM